MERRFERSTGAKPGSEPKADGTPRMPGTPDNEGWCGMADSVLLSLAQEAGLEVSEGDVSSYLAVRVAPRDAPAVVGFIRGASSRRLTVRRARTVRLTCIGSGDGSTWVRRFDFDALSEPAPSFVDAVRGGRGLVLTVVFAGPSDLSEGWVAWAGFIRSE